MIRYRQEYLEQESSSHPRTGGMACLSAFSEHDGLNIEEDEGNLPRPIDGCVMKYAVSDSQYATIDESLFPGNVWNFFDGMEIFIEFDSLHAVDTVLVTWGGEVIPAFDATLWIRRQDGEYDAIGAVRAGYGISRQQVYESNTEHQLGFETSVFSGYNPEMNIFGNGYATYLRFMNSGFMGSSYKLSIRGAVASSLPCNPKSIKFYDHGEFHKPFITSIENGNIDSVAYGTFTTDGLNSFVFSSDASYMRFSKSDNSRYSSVAGMHDWSLSFSMALFDNAWNGLIATIGGTLVSLKTQTSGSGRDIVLVDSYSSQIWSSAADLGTHRFCFTCRGKSLVLYVDGRVATTHSLAWEPFYDIMFPYCYTTDSLIFGTLSSSYQQMDAMKIGRICIYDHALEDLEIADDIDRASE